MALDDYKGLVVFSTSVEVFLIDEYHLERAKPSSPRPWRCFRQKLSEFWCGSVFSTSVEVFPAINGRSQTSASLLHVRGGVSSSSSARRCWNSSSPRPWRCFLGSLCEVDAGAVFSTSVEVFLGKGLLE